MGKLPPLRPRRPSLSFLVAWKLVPPKDPESCRWECLDGRWVALTIGHDTELGKVVVTDSGGRREQIESYEDALALAKLWRD